MTTGEKLAALRRKKGITQEQLASYNLYTRKWIRVSGTVEVENALEIREAMLDFYPMIRQEYVNRDEIFLVIFRVTMENAAVN